MSIKSVLVLTGGVLIITGLFLPAINHMGGTFSLFDFIPGVRYLFLTIAAIIIFSVFLRRKLFGIVRLLLSVILLLLVMKYIRDVKSEVGTVGSGLWVLLTGSLCSITGTIGYLFSKPRKSSFGPNGFGEI